jgi:hypothetical protein
MKPKVLVTTVAALAALLAVPAGASAATSLYAPDQNARTFADNAGGWTSDSDSQGACIEVLLCPTVTNSFQPSGGEDNDGFIRTSLNSLTGVGGTSIGIWTSPAFVYRGIDGEQPASIDFTLAHRSDVGQLLSAAGNSATFGVTLVAVSNKANSVTIVEPRSLDGIDDWSRIREVGVEPKQLRIGERYQLQITTSYRTGSTVVPGGSADYDDVILKARSADGGGGDGTRGNGGNGGGAGADHAALKGSGIAGKAARLTKDGRRIKVGVRCARKVGRTCKVQLTGLESRHGQRLGKTRRVRIKSGHRRKVTLHVKRQLRATVKAKRTILVHEKVRSHGHRKAKVVRLKLRHS